MTFQKGYIPWNKRPDSICKVCGDSFRKYGHPEAEYCSPECSPLGNKGEKAFVWKGGKPKCLDCKKQVSHNSKRCYKCAGKSAK